MSNTDDALLKQPVIVVGAPRSGTTMLGELLAPHPSLYAAIEPRLIWRWGNDRKSDMLRPADARPDVKRHIRAAFAQQVRASGFERLLEKTPSNALRLPFVDAVFPDGKIIHILRHGVDSILSIRSYWENTGQGFSKIRKGRIRQRLREASLRQLPHYGGEVLRRMAPAAMTPLMGRNIWGPRIPGIRTMLNELDLLEVCCLQWRMCVESACAYGRTLPGDRYREVRLETLDLEQLRELLRFAGLESSDAVLEQFEKTHRPELASARSAEASDADLAMMHQWIAPTLSWLGYTA